MNNEKLYAINVPIVNDEYSYLVLKLKDNYGFINSVASPNREEYFKKYKPPIVSWEKSNFDKKTSDCIPCLGFYMVFSEKAKNLLWPYLKENGALVEFSLRDEKFYGYMTWKEFDNLSSHEPGAEFVFNKNKKTHLFVSETVKNIIEEAGLTGFEFELRTDH